MFSFMRECNHETNLNHDFNSGFIRKSDRQLFFVQTGQCAAHGTNRICEAEMTIPINIRTVGAVMILLGYGYAKAWGWL